MIKQIQDRYSTFGLQENWLAAYCQNPDHFFQSEHGLNINKQIPSLIAWLSDGEMIQDSKKREISSLGEYLTRIYVSNPDLVWEILWVNFCKNSGICSWFVNYLFSETEIEFSKLRDQVILDANAYAKAHHLKETSSRTIANAVTALIRLINQSCSYSERLGMFHMEMKGRTVSRIHRFSREPSTAAIAYSLYHYAKFHNLKQFTVSELYESNQVGGVYREFLIPRQSLEAALRTLQEHYGVLSAHLNMGLDNIILHNDMTPLDALKAVSLSA